MSLIYLPELFRYDDVGCNSKSLPFFDQNRLTTMQQTDLKNARSNFILLYSALFCFNLSTSTLIVSWMMYRLLDEESKEYYLRLILNEMINLNLEKRVVS